MVSRWIGAAGNRNGPVGRVVVGQIFLVRSAMVSGRPFVTRLQIKSFQVVMRAHVFGIQSERPLKLLDGLPQKLLLARRISALGFGALVISRAQFVDHLVILAEI